MTRARALPHADDLVTIQVRRSDMTLVAPPPATVTQRNCLDLFGVSRSDYMRMVAKKRFAVRKEGQLRIARYEDVEAYLAGPRVRRKNEEISSAAPRQLDPVAFLVKAGARPR